VKWRDGRKEQNESVQDQVGEEVNETVLMTRRAGKEVMKHCPYLWLQQQTTVQSDMH
jgi:hypothetical protein